VRLPDVTVPLATYTGWALRAGPHAPDGCEGSGQMIPFPKTQAEREASGDPRRSIEERYPTFVDYHQKVVQAIRTMVEDRLLLCEDADDELERVIAAGLARGVPPPPAEQPPTPGLCSSRLW
jgi:Alpha/beta hydrolase domain